MKTKVEIEMEITPEIIDAIAEKLISSGDYAPVVHGHWIKHQLPYGYDCSACGDWVVNEYEYNYCPNCGAKMDGEDNA